MSKIPYPNSIVDRFFRNVIIDLVDAVNGHSKLIEDIKYSKPITDKSQSDYTGIKAPVLQPTDFTLEDHELSGAVYTNGDYFVTDYIVRDERKEFGKVYYVDQKNGDNSNDGLTPDKALASMSTAYNKTDVGTIVVIGMVCRYNGTYLMNLTKDINIIGYNEEAKLIMADLLSYQKESGYNNVYSAVRAGVGGVVDLSKKVNGGYESYTRVETVDEVESNPRTFTTLDGKVYVNHNKTPISDELISTLTSSNLTIPPTGASYVYMENIEIIGGARPFRNENENAELYFYNVKFLHGTQSNGNGLEIVGGKKVISERCHASHNAMDGFNYHKGKTGSLPYFIEINCSGNNNGALKGTGGSRSDNGSTAHDGVKGIRLNGIYGNNDGGTIADVNEGTETWNLGVTAFNSLQGSDFLTSTGAKMWLDHCVSFGTSRSVNAINENDMVFTRNCTFKGTIAGNGQVTEY